jgi:hypothetical protein
MSTQSEVPQISHTDAAQALIEQVRAMRQQIPNFVPVSKAEVKRLNSAASLPPAFIELAVAVVKNSATLVRGGGPDPVQTRDRMSFAEAYLPLAHELETLAEFVRQSCIVAKNKAGSDALTTYALARRLARRPETVDLAPHVVEMRLALGSRARGRKAKPVPTTGNSGSTGASPATAASPAAALKSS